MAYLATDPNQQTQQGQQQNQIPTVPQIPTLQGTSGTNAGSGSGTSGTTNTASPGAAPTTPWQNITTYLSANAGQAGNVAGTIANNLQTQYNATNQGIQNAQQNFGQQIDSARNPLNQSIASQAATNPGQFVQDPNNVAAFQKMFNQGYTGPQSFSGSQDYSNLQSQVQNAQKQAALVNGGTEGLMTLLQQAESANGKNPSQGVTALDSLLLQESPNNFATLNAATQPFAGLTNYLSSTQQGLDTAASNAAKEAANTNASLQNQFLGQNGVVPSFQDKLNQELQTASKQATGYNQQISDIMSALNAGQGIQNPGLIDPSGTLAALVPYGTSGGIFQNMVGSGFPGVSPNMLAQFYNAPPQVAQPTMANVMSSQDLADAQALNQLVGQNAVNVPTQLGNPFSVPTGYGSFNSQSADKALYDTLMNDQGAMSQMNGPQLNSYLNDLNTLAGWLGLPGATAPAPAPTPPDTAPSGPPYLAPPGTGTRRGI